MPWPQELASTPLRVTAGKNAAFSGLTTILPPPAPIAPACSAARHSRRLVVVGVGAADVALLRRRGVAAASQRRRILGKAAVVGRADIERHAGTVSRVEYRAGGRAASCRGGHAEAHPLPPGIRRHAVARHRRKQRRLLGLDHDLAAVGTDRAGMQRRTAQRRLIVVGIGAADVALLHGRGMSSRRSAAAHPRGSCRSWSGRCRGSCPWLATA